MKEEVNARYIEKDDQIKAKAMFDEKTGNPAVKETFIASSGWIQNFMKDIISYAGQSESITIHSLIEAATWFNT